MSALSLKLVFPLFHLIWHVSLFYTTNIFNKRAIWDEIEGSILGLIWSNNNV